MWDDSLWWREVGVETRAGASVDGRPMVERGVADIGLVSMKGNRWRDVGASDVGH